MGKARPAAILAEKAGRLSRIAVVSLCETSPRFSSSRRCPGPPAGPALTHSPVEELHSRPAAMLPVHRGATGCLSTGGKVASSTDRQPRAARSEVSRTPGRRAKSGRALREGKGDGAGRGGGRQRCGSGPRGCGRDFPARRCGSRASPPRRCMGTARRSSRPGCGMGTEVSASSGAAEPVEGGIGITAPRPALPAARR